MNVIIITILMIFGCGHYVIHNVFIMSGRLDGWHFSDDRLNHGPSS